jgi:hypothetical protein
LNTNDYSDVVSTKVLARIEVEGADVTRTFDIKDKYNLTEFGCVADNAEITYQIDVLKSEDYSK